MRFEQFKEKITEGLQELYGDSAELDTGIAVRNNGSKYNGVLVRVKNSQSKATPIVELDSIYEAFESGRMDMGECVREVYHQREALKSSEEIERLAESAMEWELVKDEVYPILLSTEENRELLESLVSTPMLDLSVAYIIRGGTLGRCPMSIKVSKGLLKYYGINSAQLHRQAMKNMEKDGYRFLDMKSMIEGMCGVELTEGGLKIEMYVLTNTARLYGAAGILNRKLLKEFAGGRDFIILPSSQHETIFVPVNDKTDQGFFDGMVREVNSTQVSAEERLSGHSYYYDAAIGEVRMCA